MRSITSIITVMLILVLLFLSACERHITSEDPSRTIPNVGPAPGNIALTIDDESVTISWAMTPSASIARYRIYRSDATGLDFEVIDSTTATQITISGLTRNVQHLFQIVPVLTSGIEGERSEIISARLTPLSIVINTGNESTNSRNIQVQVNTVVTASSIRISEDPTFADAVYEAYAALQGFNLSEGDGTKTVYVDLIFADGSKTGSPLSDDIILDTKSSIDSTRILSGAQTYGVGDTIVFAVYTQEIGGTANATFSNRGAALVDDGTDVDVTADDGIYTGYFEVPEDLNVFNATVTGAFTDASGNQAQPLPAVTKVNVQTPPQPVQISAVANDTTTVSISWTRSNSSDFAAYLVCRDQTSSVDTNDQITAITNTGALSYLDNTLSPGTTYYYRIFVKNFSGLVTGSATFSVTTPASSRAPSISP